MLREQVQKQKRSGRADARFVADTDIRSRVERWNKMEAIRWRIARAGNGGGGSGAEGGPVTRC